MLRYGAILALALLITGCDSGSARAPFTDSRLPPGLGLYDGPPEGWAWGLIGVGHDPPQRYGVIGPSATARAQVLILPSYGDFAEDYYAVAADFAGRGYVVWVLDGAGQGGSGRWVEPRDLGYVRSFDDDVAVFEAMARQVIRPSATAPLIVIAAGTAGPVAVRGLQLDRPPISGMVLAAPVLRPSDAPDLSNARLAQRLLLGAIRSPGGGPWKRNRPSPERRRIAWQAANPDLRMGDPSLGWFAAFDDLTMAMTAAGWRGLNTPVLILTESKPDADWERICRTALPRCASEAASPQSLNVQETKFIEGFLAKLAGPTALPNPDPHR